MGLNFAGIGFSFGAKDEGFNDQADKAADALNGIASAAKSADDIARTSKLNLLANAFQSIQLSRIDDQMESLSESAVRGGSSAIELVEEMTDATSQIEAAYAGQGKAGARAAALIRKSYGVAGATIDEARQAVNAFRQRFDIKEIEKDFVPFFKLIKLTGTSVDEFADSLAIATKRFGLSSDQAKLLTAQVIAVGGASGQATEAFQQMPKIVETINETMAGLRRNLSPEEFRKMVVGTTQLAGVFKKVGIPMTKSTDLSLQLIRKFGEMSENVDDLRRGLGGSLDSFTEFGKAGLSVDKIFTLLRTSPAEAIKSLAKMGKTFDRTTAEGEARFDRFRAVLVKEFGKDFKGLMDKLVSKGSEEALAINLPKNAQEAEKAIGKFTNTLMKSGKVQRDMLERTREKFKATFGEIAQKVFPDVKASARKNLMAATERLKELADPKTLRGRLLSGLIAVKEQGFMALGPALAQVNPKLKRFGDDLAVLGPVLEGTGEFMIPVLLGLTAMGFRLTTLFKPLELAGKGVFKLTKKFIGLGAASQAAQLSTSGANTALATTGTQSVVAAAAAGGVSGKISGLFAKLKDKVGGKKILGLFGSLKTGLVAVGSKIATVVGAISAPFVIALGFMLAGVGAFIHKVIKHWDDLSLGLTELWVGISETFSGLWAGAKEIVLNFAGWMSGIFSEIWTGAKEIFFDFVGWFNEAIGNIIGMERWNAFKDTIFGFFNTFKNSIFGFFKSIFSGLGSIVTGMLDYTKAYLSGIVNFFKNLWTGKMGSIFAGLLKGEISLWDAFKEAFKADKEIMGKQKIDVKPTATTTQEVIGSLAGQAAAPTGLPVEVASPTAKTKAAQTAVIRQGARAHQELISTLRDVRNTNAMLVSVLTKKSTGPKQAQATVKVKADKDQFTKAIKFSQIAAGRASGLAVSGI